MSRGRTMVELNNVAQALEERRRRIGPVRKRVASRERRKKIVESVSPQRHRVVEGEVVNGTKAVLVGVGYRGQKKEIKNATKDTRELSSLLASLGFTGEQWVLADDEPRMKPTRQNIIQSLRWLVSDAVAGDALFLSFIGLAGYVNHNTKQHGVAPSDHQQSGLISEDEIRGLLSGLPTGVRITVLCDAGFGGTFLNLPFKIWAEEGGVGNRAEPDAPQGGAEIILLAAARDERSFELGVGPPGNLLPAFISAVRASCGVDGHTYRSLLQSVKSELKARRCSLSPQFSTNSHFDFSSPFGFDPPTPAPASVQSQFTPASYSESALHQAAAMGWQPSHGPPSPPSHLSPSPRRNRKGMSVRVTAPEGCKIDLQCEPLQSASPPRSLSTALEPWEVNSTKELPIPPSTGPHGHMSPNGYPPAQPSSSPERGEREKIYRLRRKRSAAAKRATDQPTAAASQDTKAVLLASRRREKEIELGQLERYKRQQQATVHERRLRQKFEEGEVDKEKKDKYLERLAKHAERVHAYSKNLPKKKKHEEPPPQLPVEDTTEYFSPQRVSPLAPDNSPKHRSVVKKVHKQTQQLDVMHGKANDLLDQHMLQRRVLEEQLEQLQEGRSVSATITAPSERSATPELSNAYAQTMNDPSKKEAIKMLIQHYESTAPAGQSPITPLRAYYSHAQNAALPPCTPSPTPVQVAVQAEEEVEQIDRSSQVTAADLRRMDKAVIRVHWKLLKKYVPFRKVQRLRKQEKVLDSPSPEQVKRPETPEVLQEEPSPVHPVVEAVGAEEAEQAEGEWVWNEETQEYDWVVPEGEGEGEEEAKAGEWVWNEETQDYDWVEAEAEEETAAGEWVWNEETQDYDWVVAEVEQAAEEPAGGEWVWNEETQDHDWVEAVAEVEEGDAAGGEWVWNEETQDYDWVEASAEATEQPSAGGEWVWNEETQDHDWVES